MNNKTKLILIYGCAAGLIVSSLSLITFGFLGDQLLENGMIYGYTAMLLSCIPIFLGIKKIRDKIKNGSISFGAAFGNGLLIALLGSIFYSLGYNVWVKTHPDFYPKWEKAAIAQINAKPGAEAAKQLEIKEIKEMLAMLQKPAVSYLEPILLEYLPIGIIISLISALILRRKIELS